MNQQITNLDMFEFIGRQALQIDFLGKQVEQLTVMVQQSQKSAVEAQEVAKKLHHQMQKSAMKNNGAEVEQLGNEPSYSASTK